MKKLSAIISLAAAGVLFLCWWLFIYQSNPLKKYGVEYKIEHGEHYSVVIISFWVQAGNERIVGPSFIGDDLAVSFADVDRDGIDEIIVKSKAGNQAIAKLIIKDGKAIGFHILQSDQIGISFAKEGFYCP